MEPGTLGYAFQIGGVDMTCIAFLGVKSIYLQ